MHAEVAKQVDTEPTTTHSPSALAADKEVAASIVLRRQPFLVGVNTVGAILYALTLWLITPELIIAGWLAAMLLIQAGRLVLYSWLDRSTHASWRESSLFLLTFGHFLSGVAWGAACLLLVPFGDTAKLVVSAFAMACLSAGSVVTLIPYLPAFYAFVLPLLVMQILRGMIGGEIFGLAVAAFGSIYALVLVFYARRLAGLLRESAAARARAAGRVKQLSGEKHDLERTLVRRAAEFEALTRTMPAAIWIAHDTNARKVTGNAYAEQLMRIKPRGNHSLQAPDSERPKHFHIRRNNRRLQPPEYPLHRAAHGKDVKDEEIRVCFDDGSYRDTVISASPVLDPAGSVVGAVGAAIDITERRRGQEALRLSEERFRDFAKSASDWLWETDREHRFTWMSPDVGEKVGVPAEWHYDQSRLDLLVQVAGEDAVRQHRETLEAHLPFRDFEYLRGGPKGQQWLSTSGIPVFDAEGAFQGYRGVAREITERKHAEERIAHFADHDPLTSLANRRLLHNRLSQAMAMAARQQRRCALLIFDLDHFKEINDMHGHLAGDRMLVEVADRVRPIIRESDCLARFGGDEFALMVGDAGSAEAVATIAERLLACLDEPIDIEGRATRVSASIGIAMSPDDTRSIDDLLRFADLALYRAKEDGRGCIRFYEMALDARVRQRKMVEQQLQTAIARGEFELHYQPQYDLDSNRMVGVEALLRWQHPERGLLLPGHFIALAESSRLIFALGAWVVDAVCRQARQWQDKGWDLTIAVNLSQPELADEHLLARLDRAMSDHGVASRYLEFEVTERTMMESMDERLIRNLHGITERDITVSLDDFGVGSSSLSRLRSIPASKIKIDRSFIDRISKHGDDEALVALIVSLGHTLRKRVLAEGVETAEQLEFLRQCQCNEVQGYFLGRPMTAAEIDPTRPINVAAIEASAAVH